MENEEDKERNVKEKCVFVLILVSDLKVGGVDDAPLENVQS